MSLRSILAQEGLLKSSSLALSKRTLARLNGGSSAVKMGVADLMAMVPGKDVLAFQEGHEAGYGKKFTLKPGWAKIVDATSARVIVDALGRAGFDANTREGNDIDLSKIASPTPGAEHGGVTVWVAVVKTVNGEFAILNGNTGAVYGLMSSLRKERHGDRGFEGFSASLR